MTALHHSHQKTGGVSKLPVLALLFLWLGLGVAQAADFAGQLDTLLDDKGAIWTLAADRFLTPGFGPYFRWLAADKKDEAHYPGYGNSPSLTFLGSKVTEANMRFRDGTLGTISLSLFNRGDQGDLSEAQFSALLAEIDTHIVTWSGDKGCEPRKTRVAGKEMLRRAWVKAPYALILSWSSSGVSKRDFRAEYIQLDITPFDPKNDPRKMLSAPTGGKPVAAHLESTLDKIVKNDNGDIFLDGVPMVDQGQKGYCAVATTERILRFYGMDVSEHVIAQLAESDAGRGTSAELMLKMLKRAATKFGVKVREHYTAVENIKDLQEMVSKYNRIAKKDKSSRITLPTAGVIDLGTIYAGFEPGPFKKYRCEGEKVAYKRFLFDVRDHVEKGIPLCWAVFLGLAPEAKLLPQTTGAHMRIIIGYNDTTSEIIYSDSWGAGHEFKKMSYDDAWTITTGLYTFDPRRQ